MNEAIYLGRSTPEQDEALIREIDKVTSKWCNLCNGSGERATYYEDGNLQFLGKCEGCNGTGIKEGS